jgi:hypothetical protein
MDETTVRIVLDDTSITAAQLAVWVREVAPDQYTLKEAMYIARCMIRGERWQPPYEIVAYGLKHLPSQPWTYTIDTPANEWTVALQARQAEYAHGQELARLGAEGDSVAAQRFCKLFLAGVMINSAMG